MSVTTMSLFFAVLSLLSWVGAIALICLSWIAARRPDSATAGLADELGHNALWLAWLVAAVATAGSLYFSGVANFVPCELCWYQRIATYPMAIILLVAAVRRDSSVWRYAVGPLALGTVVAVYHSQLQAFPEQKTFCSSTVPCSIRYVYEFGFVSLPLMALSAFVFILAALALAHSTARRQLAVVPASPSVRSETQEDALIR